MLLEYARKSCSARLALLFALDEERQVLALLEYSGRLPHPSTFSSETKSAGLSLQGLFASVLQCEGFVDIPDIAHNPLSLSEERALAWPHSRVLLHALRQGQHQGVLVFCFSPTGSHVVLGPQVEEELLICSSLLSAYLSGEEDFQSVRRVPPKPERSEARTKRTSQLSNVEDQERPEHEESIPQPFAEFLNLLTLLCELGLLTSSQLEKQELGQQILQLFSAIPHVRAGCLWRYQLEPRAFLLQTFTDKPGVFVERASAELDKLAKTLPITNDEAASGLIALPESDEYVLVWHILCYREQVLGALGLLVTQRSGLFADQWAWLDMLCEMVALILLHYDQKIMEQQTLLEEERRRIAHEMHDSVVQDIAYVTQKLDYIQHILEKQPQAALNEVEQARQLLNRSLRDLRYGISALLPLPLE